MDVYVYVFVFLHCTVLECLADSYRSSTSYYKYSKKFSKSPSVYGYAAGVTFTAITVLIIILFILYKTKCCQRFRRKPVENPNESSQRPTELHVLAVPSYLPPPYSMEPPTYLPSPPAYSLEPPEDDAKCDALSSLQMTPPPPYTPIVPS